jgi:hypothetical protein
MLHAVDHAVQRRLHGTRRLKPSTSFNVGGFPVRVA